MTNQEAIRYFETLLTHVDMRAVSGLEAEEAIQMAISALQAQDSRRICNTCKHDPPSKRWPCVDCDMREPADRWEPKDVPDANVGDTISRQAAIDAAIEAADDWDDWCKSRSTMITNAINSLPPVQPEIVRCKDCKHRGEKPIADGRYWCELHDTFMYYCSDAERRTDEGKA